MKKTILIAVAALCLLPGSLAARKKAPATKKADEITFTTIKANPITSIKDQNQSGTCWAYSSLGFSRPNSCAWARAHTTFASRSSYITLIWTVPTRLCAHMAM